MSFVKDAVEDVGDAVSDGFGFVKDEIIDPILGNNVADAAKEAARIAERQGNLAIESITDSQLRLEETLFPFVKELGLDLLPQIPLLFGGSTKESIINNPVFNSLFDEAQRRIEARQGASGRPFAETSQFLQDAFIRTGADLLSRERADLLSALNFGQSSAAQTGVSGVNTAGQVGDLLTQIANSQGAGLITAANAKSQGVGNILDFGGKIIGFGAG